MSVDRRLLARDAVTLPGERVTEEVVAYLRELTGAGPRLHGAADPTFATVRVLIESEM